MPEFATMLAQKSDEEILQLWRDRDRLPDADIDPLRDEIERRGLLNDAEQIVETTVRAFNDGPSIPPQNYLNTSIFFWCVRELWLRSKTRNGVSVAASVDKVSRLKPQNKTAGRSELTYRYKYQGTDYSGRVVRDFLFPSSATQAFVDNHQPGQTIQILVNRVDPGISYYPSGLGFLFSIVGGGLLLLFWSAMFLGVAAGLVALLVARSSK
jgi:hypothetical protein